MLLCQAAQAEPTLHILDCTDLVVNFKDQHYEHSGISTRNQRPERGYKLATLRSLLDQGAVLTAIGWGSIERHDLTLTHDLVRETPHLRPGDTLIEGRGFLDAATITHLKRTRDVDVCTGLKEDMLLLRGAIAQARANPGHWQPHPTRKSQQIQRVCGLGGLWQGLGVPMSVCVVRFQDKKTGGWAYLGFATTDLPLWAKQIIQTYQLRPGIEEDYRQLKSASWRIDQFCATRLVQILWHVVLRLIAYNLFQVYAHTEQGRAVARKTKQKTEREQGRNPPTYLLACTQEAFGVFETKALLYVLLDLPEDVRHKIRALLPQRLD